MKAGELRPGMALRVDGKLFVVVKYEHRTPGNLRAFVQVKLRDVQSGQHLEKRLNPSDSVEGALLDRRLCEYLYQETAGFVFMDNETFDQVTLNPELVGDAAQYLPPNAQATLLFNEGSPILIELPSAVELRVAECQPGIKGATATNQLKEAVMETGLKTRVPPFIEEGEMLKISTSDGSYMGRVKEATA